MDPLEQHLLQQTRREFLGKASRGLGAVALASLLNGTSASAAQPWAGITNPTHMAPKAKRVIMLTMAGGPSHLETLDYKPELAKYDGEPMPEAPGCTDDGDSQK